MSDDYWRGGWIDVLRGEHDGFNQTRRDLRGQNTSDGPGNVEFAQRLTRRVNECVVGDEVLARLVHREQLDAIRVRRHFL